MISLGEDRQALVKACESMDADLVYLALLHLLRRQSPQDLLVTHTSKLPLARSLLLSYMRHKEPGGMRELYTLLDLPLQAAHASLREVYASPDQARQKKHCELLHKAHSGSKVEVIKHLASAAKDQSVLIEAQQELENMTGNTGEFVGSTAADTVRLCFRYNHHKRGLKLAKDIRMHEKLLCAVRVDGLAEGNDWVELEKLSRERKIPPIGDSHAPHTTAAT